MRKSLKDFGRYIENALIDWRIPGAAVAVVKEGEILHRGGYGYRDLEQQLPVTEDTRFPIASMTKPFTALGAALLVEEGLLSWDQPIRDVMPEFRLADEYATQHASLRDLLAHRTGLPRHDSTWYGTGKNQAELLAGLRHLSPSASFRQAWQYNNLMYETVGLLCARLTNAENWEAFIQERVIGALAMHDTTANATVPDRQFDNVALPYQLRHGEEQPEPMPVYVHPHGSPAGSIHSTLNDLICWFNVHTQEGSGNNPELISPYHLKQMHTPHMLIPATPVQEKMFGQNLYSYGLGWFIEPYQGVTLIHHGGNLNGFSLMGGFIPQEKLAVVVLTNINAKGLRTALLYEAVDRALGVSGTRDWSKAFLERDNETVQAALAGNKSARQDRLANAPHQHPLERYAGTYCTPAYADIEINYQDGGLRVALMGQWWKLEHRHYEVFEIDMSDPFQEKMPLSFITDRHGLITGLQVPIEPAIDDLVFKRSPLTLDPEIQLQLTGRFRHPVAGQCVQITADGNSLYLHLDGQDKQLLHCVENQPNRCRFRFANNARSLIDVVAGGDGYQQLFIKHPGSTYECCRIATANVAASEQTMAV